MNEPTELRLNPLHVLPPHVISEVFVAALSQHEVALRAVEDSEKSAIRKRDPRRVLPLVSKGFLQASLDAAGLWHRVQLNLLTLSTEAVPRLIAWLATHAASIRCLVLHGRPLATVAQACMQHADALAAAVQQATGLQQLDLSRQLGVAVMARLPDPQGLPHLRAVGIDLHSSSSSTWLHRADDGSAGGLNEVQLAAANLLALPALSELMLQSSLEAGPMFHLPSLQRLQRLQIADARDVAREPLLAPLACLSHLSSLRFQQRDGFTLPGPLTALGRLAHLHAAVRYRDDPLVVGADISRLTSLRALWLQHAAFDLPASLAALPALDTLCLVGAAAADPGVLAGLAGATALRTLHLEAHASAVAEVPAEVWQELRGIHGLTRLELPYCRLRELPPGAYLSCLRVLDLSHNSLMGVPPALAEHAGQLSLLSLGQQEAAAPGEAEADVALLCTLPHLRLLVSSAGHYSTGHLLTGLRSPAEAAHLQRLRAVLPPAVRVTNQQAEFERAAGRLASLFEVNLRQDRL